MSNNRYLNKFLAPIVILIGAIFFSSCPTPEFINYKISKNKEVQKLCNEGFPIYEGDELPEILGAYRQIKMGITQYLPEKTPSSYKNLQIEFEKIPNSEKFLLTRIIFLDDFHKPMHYYECETRYSCQGNFFTLYFDHSERNKESGKQIYSQFVLSGEKTQIGLKDFQFIEYKRYYHVIYGQLYSEYLYLYDNTGETMPAVNKMRL